jgi:23S rRNA (adenine1618-N6)-methyltransferase
LHFNNKHQGRYPFQELVEHYPPLKPYVLLNPSNVETIDFFDPEAVKMLNKALLKYYYGLEHWDIPEHYLCPPIPGRADYIHTIAAFLGVKKNVKQQVEPMFRCLDVGTGANCIYPIIGVHEYGWNFVGSEIDEKAIGNAEQLIALNGSLTGKVSIRKQDSREYIFRGILQAGEYFDLSICNPPFHASAAEAARGSLRKLNNLKQGRQKKVSLNFGGKANELWCKGGEKAFVGQMIRESVSYAKQCRWFSSLVSKESHLPLFYGMLKRIGAKKIETLAMGQGSKKSRILVWTFKEEE